MALTTCGSKLDLACALEQALAPSFSEEVVTARAGYVQFKHRRLAVFRCQGHPARRADFEITFAQAVVNGHPIVEHLPVPI